MPNDTDELKALEKRVARLEQLVATLAKQLGVRTDNPDDRKVVRDKPTFDWQKR